MALGAGTSSATKETQPHATAVYFYRRTTGIEPVMNLSFCSSLRSSQRQGGVATIVMLALLSLILIYIAANTRALNQLHRELKLTEQRQLQRWNNIQPATAESATNAIETPVQP